MDLYSLGEERRQDIQARGTACAKTYTCETTCLMDMNGVKFI